MSKAITKNVGLWFGGLAVAIAFTGGQALADDDDPTIREVLVTFDGVNGDTLTIRGDNLIGRKTRDRTVVMLGEHGLLEIVGVPTDNEIMVKCFVDNSLVVPPADDFECNDGDYKLTVLITKPKKRRHDDDDDDDDDDDRYRHKGKKSGVKGYKIKGKDSFDLTILGDGDGDPINELQSLSRESTDITLSNGGGTVSIADNDNNPANELQDLSSSGSGNSRTIFITGGKATTISVADNDFNPSNELQTLSRSGTSVSLSSGGGTVSVADDDSDPKNELNTRFSRSGDNLFLTDAGGQLSVNLSGIGGDNLGNHTATTSLDMANQDITNVKDIFPPSSAIYSGETGRFRGAAGFVFPVSRPGPGRTSLAIESDRFGESSGIAMNGSTITLWSPGNLDRLLGVYDEDGMVEKWYLNGNGVAFTVSDFSLKENISVVDDGLSRALALRGVTYNMIGESTDPADRVIGVIAQEVEKVVPEAVTTSETGLKFVNYSGLIPVLIEAVKAQQARIDALEARLTARETRYLSRNQGRQAIVCPPLSHPARSLSARCP